MSTLNITEEAARMAHENAKASGKELLENLFGKKVFQKDVKQRIQSIDDAVKELGEEDPEVVQYLKLESAGITAHILHSQMLVVIIKALNEGWVPDWQNGEWDKWYNWFNMSSSSSGQFSFYHSVTQLSNSGVGSRLCFKSQELSEYAATQFIDIYEKAFTI
jgi:hypothetical protein